VSVVTNPATRRLFIRLIATFAVLAVVAGGAFAWLRPDGSSGAGGERPPAADPVPGAVLPVAAGDVLPAATAGASAPSRSALAQALRPLVANTAVGPALSVDVVDPLTGEHLYASKQATARPPASTAKLLTAAAALTTLGPQTRLATRVVAPTAGRLVLVGGGDVLLGRSTSDDRVVDGRAGLKTLARSTAAALRAQGRSSVRLALDDSLFSGPSRAPGWSPGDVGAGFVAPVHALALDAGRLNGRHYAPRAADPGLAAANTFAGLLRSAGIKITGPVQRGRAGDAAPVLAEVRSATVADQLEYALTESDNTVAEALARLVALGSGEPATFAGAGRAVLTQIDNLGVPVTGAVLTDASGLGGGSRVPAQTLTGLLALAAGDAHPELRPIFSGLPVAAVSGTLVDRFGDRREKAARGVVRAKTGTLSGVSSLAGTVVDADGRLLVFAAMAARVRSTTSARAALDQLAATLAGCGCR
jgi:D-alanyl-D-alanine carboxypeptidase/D-alanyl-D-alanine-endopeptidase (penicillin-binding protein 4)